MRRLIIAGMMVVSAAGVAGAFSWFGGGGNGRTTITSGNFISKGTYSALANYSANSRYNHIVGYGNPTLLYVALLNSTGQTPGGNSTYWGEFTGPVGPNGSNGTNGTNGSNGTNGTNGTNGRGISTVALISGNHAPGTTDTYQITYTDTTTQTYGVYNGANGTSGGTSGSQPFKNLSSALTSTASSTTIANGDSLFGYISSAWKKITWANFQTALSSWFTATFLDTDGTMAGNSDVKVPSQKAVRTYVAANGGVAAIKSALGWTGTSGNSGTFAQSSGLGSGSAGYQVTTDVNGNLIASSYLTGASGTGLTITPHMDVRLYSTYGCAAGWQSGALASEVATLVTEGVNPNYISCIDASSWSTMLSSAILTTSATSPTITFTTTYNATLASASATTSATTLSIQNNSVIIGSTSATTTANGLLVSASGLVTLSTASVTTTSNPAIANINIPYNVLLSSALISATAQSITYSGSGSVVLGSSSTTTSATSPAAAGPIDIALVVEANSQNITVSSAIGSLNAGSYGPGTYHTGLLTYTFTFNIKGGGGGGGGYGDSDGSPGTDGGSGGVVNGTYTCSGGTIHLGVAGGGGAGNEGDTGTDGGGGGSSAVGTATLSSGSTAGVLAVSGGGGGGGGEGPGYVFGPGGNGGNGNGSYGNDSGNGPGGIGYGSGYGGSGYNGGYGGGTLTGISIITGGAGNNGVGDTSGEGNGPPSNGGSGSITVY